MNTLKWIGIIATSVITSGSMVFGMMHFAYNDFDTQRTNDIYRGQVDKRLDSIQDDIKTLDKKIDRIVLYLKDERH